MYVSLMGIPASGKTTIMKKIINQSDDWQTKKFKKLRFMMNKSQKLIIMGIYPKEGTFAGTDMLSMAVQPDAIDFLNKFSSKYPDYNFLSEGDRLTTASFFDKVEDVTYLKLIRLKNDEMIMNARRKNRDQPEHFIKRIETKIENILKDFEAETMPNNNEEDMEKVIEKINGLLWKKKIKRR